MNVRCSTTETTLCVQCGDRGFTNAFVYCIKCLNVAVHRYCLDVIPNTIDEFVQWFCDGCDEKVQNQPVVQCKTRDQSTFNHVQVLEHKLDGKFEGHTMYSEDKNTQNVKQAQEDVYWVRPSIQRLKPNVMMYVKMDICGDIRFVLQAIGGDDAIKMFRNGCFGYFLDFRGGGIARKAINALMGREVHISDPGLEGRECWFHIHGSILRFGPCEYNLVSGLRFGRSSFDPNADHHIPERGIFHRLFQGKRTTVAEMLKIFKEHQLANHLLDYVKIANILFIYLMVFCIDPKRVIDNWIWALVEDEDKWNSFPWGAYSFQMFMHFIRLVPRSRAVMGGPGAGAYHFFGPIWTLQTWAVEVIPHLGLQCGTSDGHLTMPRCLKWSFSRTMVDFSTFFEGHLVLVSMVPLPDEVRTSYYQSVAIEGDILGVKYVAPRKPFKKKLLGDIASRVLQVPITRVGIANVGVGPSRPQMTHRSTWMAPHTTTQRPVDQPDSPEGIGETLGQETPTRNDLCSDPPPRSKRLRESNSDMESSPTLFDCISQYVDQRVARAEARFDASIAHIEASFTSQIAALTDLITGSHCSARQPTHCDRGPTTRSRRSAR